MKADVRSQGESKAEIRAQSVSNAIVETWFQIAHIVFSKTNGNEETSGRERSRTAGERSVSIYINRRRWFVVFSHTTLIDSRNPDLEYKIKELNTQVASLKAALHTYVILLLFT